MSLVVSNKSRRTLESLAAAVRGCEAQAAKKRAARDRLLAQAREAALEVASLTEQAAGLREILGGLDKEAYQRAFGEPFAGDEINGEVEPSREQQLADLRDLLAFLEATPEIPVDHRYWGIGLPRCESDAERIAAVDAVAVILDEDPKRRPHYSGDTKEQYGVERMFGHIRLYADVVVEREPEVADAVDVDQADEALDERMQSIGDGGEALDERMLGMGCVQESAGSRRAHNPGVANPEVCFTCGKPIAENGGVCLLGEEVDQTLAALDAVRQRAEAVSK